MKSAYPEGKVWKLLEGKLSKMEGKTRRGVEILRDARRRDNTRVHFGKSYQVVRTKEKSIYDLAQLQALAVYEMGW
jgi:hypothetical protein